MPIPTSSIPDSLRWDLKSAGREFGMTPETLSRKLNKADQSPGPDKCYSTQQLLTAAFGNIAGERLRKVTEEADNMMLRNQILRGESSPRSLLTPALEQIFVIIKQLIMGSSMSGLEKKDLLDNISTWPVVVQTAAAKAVKQTRFAGTEENNGENGQGEVEEE